jgi:hypothetical protein
MEMFKTIVTRKGQELIINRLSGNKILLSRKEGVVIRNVSLDRLETKRVSMELGCIPSRWDEVSVSSSFDNGLKLIKGLM